MHAQWFHLLCYSELIKKLAKEINRMGRLRSGCVEDERAEVQNISEIINDTLTSLLSSSRATSTVPSSRKFALLPVL